MCWLFSHLRLLFSRKLQVYLCFTDLKGQNDASQNKPGVRVVRYNPPCNSRAFRVSTVFLNDFSITRCWRSINDIVCTLLVVDVSDLPQLWFRCRMLVYTQAKLPRYQTVSQEHI